LLVTRFEFRRELQGCSSLEHPGGSVDPWSSRSHCAWLLKNLTTSLTDTKYAPLPPNLSFNTHPTWEIAFNHYHNRLGKELPRMAAVLPTIRPTGVNHQMAWETLTHAGVGAVGLPPIAAQ
jgi:hypothetical protein